MTHDATGGARQYIEAARAKLDQIAAESLALIEQSGALLADVLQAGGTIYLFGTGHSHLLAEEGHYRAGGLAAVVPILNTALMLHDGAVISTQLERTGGMAAQVLARYQPAVGDALVIFSNSGVNTVPVEMAQAGKARGMVVIAIVALDYAARVPAGAAGVKLAEVADVVIDNHGVPGDALVAVGESGLKTGALSTVAGAFILNALLTEAALRLDGADVYISANMPGAAAHNAALVEKYRPRNPHL
jgi:uncharacterized phosphosugar-binding protein